MILRYKNKSIDLYECRSFFSRFKGFMGSTNINRALLFDKCNSIHTFFMRENIEVIMCNSDNTILYYYKDLDKNKILLPKRNVSRIYELPANYFDVNIGDRLEIIR